MRRGIPPIREAEIDLRVDDMTATMKFAEAEYLGPQTKGWHPDPLGDHDQRFHDGQEWTQHVTHYGPVPCNRCNVQA